MPMMPPAMPMSKPDMPLATSVELHTHNPSSGAVGGPMVGEQGPSNVEGGFGDQVEPAPPGVTADAGNDDIQEDSVAAAVSMAHARLAELESDLATTTIGDRMMLPGSTSMMPDMGMQMTSVPAYVGGYLGGYGGQDQVYALTAAIAPTSTLTAGTAPTATLRSMASLPAYPGAYLGGYSGGYDGSGSYVLTAAAAPTVTLSALVSAGLWIERMEVVLTSGTIVIPDTVETPA